MKRASAKSIVAAKRFFQEFPNGQIPTGIWYQPSFTREEFYGWFRRCLNEKTGGGPYTNGELAKIKDARLINDYLRGARHSGSLNLLSEAKNRKKYPHINSQGYVDW
jgi:hypothetical protein